MSLPQHEQTPTLVCRKELPDLEIAHYKRRNDLYQETWNHLHKKKAASKTSLIPTPPPKTPLKQRKIKQKLRDPRWRQGATTPTSLEEGKTLAEKALFALLNVESWLEINFQNDNFFNRLRRSASQ